MIRAKQYGLTAEDLEDMTIGDVMDYIITYNNLYSEEEIREATQEDFDNF